MNKEIQDLLNTDKDLTIETIDELEGVNVATDFFSNMKNDIDSFDEDAWATKTGYKTPNFPSFAEALEGWVPGFYVFAAPSNHGKSATMLNIQHDLCANESNKLFGIYYSLDDTRNRIIPRVIAMRENIPISIVAKPGRYQEMVNEGHPDSINIQKQLDKRKEGLNKLKDDSNKLVIFESEEVEFIDDIYEKTEQIYHYVKSIDPEMNIMVAIDSLKDIALKDANKLSANERIDIIAKKIKDLSKKFNCIVFASMHLRKLNGTRRPTMDDLKDSNILEFESDVCFLMYNDVSKNKQSAKIFYKESEESIEKKPVIEIDWAKNKLSSYKGVMFCNFSPEYSKCVEVAEESAKRYNAILYQL